MSKRLPGLVNPHPQTVHQVFLAERAAFLGKQRAGFQPVQQAVQHLGVARGQGGQQVGLGAGGVAEGRCGERALREGVAQLEALAREIRFSNASSYSPNSAAAIEAA